MTEFDAGKMQTTHWQTQNIVILSRRSRQPERGFMRRACPSVRLSVCHH